MRYIVVTDLDGTLLNHKTYDYAPALNAIEELNRREIPIILNSSKTNAEISDLRRELGNHEPFVCENGGIICGIGEIEYLATPREEFLDKLAAIKEKLQLRYGSFSEATVDDVVEWTGLDSTSAAKAMQRSATEPLFWQDSDSALDNFRRELEKLSLQCVKGGRFHHVMGNFNKASCFDKLKEYYAQAWGHQVSLLGQEEVGIIALGDSPNDLPMLEKANHAIVIPSPKGNNLKLNNSSVYYATQAAPHGWSEGINAFLSGY
ncbi:HAD-IIB family hydrolase [Waterburya agarophytonicola K14]|uniref:HAD-IIB family hydrolase n=1 Tax=Waterburya agarophytonicola KI4 TaxID=2874699 RepID=A0A964FFY5_9CYAN|nr:HAD-IIB family hydrolase [Waterburya agarophytonicola]MCC0175963.1 HAD-IIB family hydrolase [Waterburya agarophytonicola KI4]